MRAVYFEEFDGESISVREVDEPRQLNPGEVLVRVRAAGLNRADLMQARGSYPPPAGYSPNIPGLEFAGEIDTIGDGVTEWTAGDRVMAITSGEAQAEKVVIDQRLLMHIPEQLSFTEAAAIPETFITAHDAVFTQGRLETGETLLVHAVGSGVGLSALQMAKSRGVSVIGTSRTSDKLERCRAFGLDLGIETADGPRFAEEAKEFTAGRGADVVLELAGGDYFPEDLSALALRGRIILVGLTAGRKSEIDLGMTLQKRARIVGTVLRARSVEEKAAATRAFADDFLETIAGSEIKPVVDRIFPAAEAKDAYKYLASNESFGKVVLEF
ncbi:MAG TPA: NAD(P)H-quinone oxidoreductase [Pyrinomonadaceae bacterium]|nr:NAD(P)H-quinone oxidoreductase [Pyrinomonadaceae bacterium]